MSQVEQWRSSTIGESGDTTISSPGRSPKQHLPGIRLHDPLHGLQACPKFIVFNQGLVKYIPGRGYFRAVPSQEGEKYVISPQPPTVELVNVSVEQFAGIEGDVWILRTGGDA